MAKLIKRIKLEKTTSILVLLAIIMVGVGLMIGFFRKTFATGNTQASLTVIELATNDKTGYAVYWDKSLGSARLERKEGDESWTVISDKNQFGYFVDYVPKAGGNYTYQLSVSSATFVATAAKNITGKPTISNIETKPGVVGKSEASMIVTFKTDKPAKSQLFYGESLPYSSQTALSSYLNQSHTVVIENLKPNTAYHFKIKTTDKTEQNSSESDDQVFATPKALSDQNVLEIIIDALRKAFAGFEKWFSS